MTTGPLPVWGARGVRPTTGQSTVELAFVLPVIVILLLALIQGAVVVRDHVLTVNAAREAVREASVGGDDRRVDAAAQRVLEGADAEIRRRGKVGDPVVVVVHFTVKTDVPLVGLLLPDVDLEARSTMRAER